jgi:hypothetical protein
MKLKCEIDVVRTGSRQFKYIIPRLQGIADTGAIPMITGEKTVTYKFNFNEIIDEIVNRVVEAIKYQVEPEEPEEPEEPKIPNNPFGSK